MLFKKNLKFLRKNSDLSQLALSDKLQISDKTISSWEIGRTEPNMEQLHLLSKLFDVSMDSLLNSDIEQEEKSNKKQSILNKFKLYENPVSAGLGTWLDEGTEYNYIEIEHTEIDADFALKVRGDSMSPMYNDGDIVFVKSLKLIEPGQIGVFLINGEGYLKQWQGNRLLSLNSKYEPITIDENDEFMAVGKVIDKMEREN